MSYPDTNTNACQLEGVLVPARQIEVEPIETEPGLKAAAILHDGTTDVDALLYRIADQQQQAGRCVRGFVMTFPDGGIGCAKAMVLLDLDTREQYLVSQPLGRTATSCRADPQGFARASEVLRRALEESPDLVISNRFGGLEAEGGGFRAELLEILVRDVPLLTAVASRHVDAWRSFTGGAVVLPACEQAIAEWLAATLGPPLAATERAL